MFGCKTSTLKHSNDLYKVSSLVSQDSHDILCRRDLSRKYGFQNIDGDSLKKELLDSPGFVEFCELE